DLGLCRMEHEPMWQEYAAGIFWARPTPLGLAFTAQLSAFILDNILRGGGRWFLDQVGLYVCREKYGSRAGSALLPPDQYLDLERLTVIDAGANIGSHALAFSKFVGRHGRVYAFEPQRLVYQLLAANLAANGITNVYSFPKGLASKPGTMGVATPHEADNFG